MDKNKLIADFMGMKYDDSRFQDDWNWLMEVVKEIYRVSEDLPFAPEVMIDVMRDALADASIKGTYDAVVDILMYRLNENK